jgi:hypothetical protein
MIPTLEENSIKAWAVMLWQEAQTGTLQDYGVITKDEWYKLKWTEEPSSKRAIAGFGYAVSGLFFGGHLENAFANPSFLHNDLLRQGKLFKDVTFRHLDYKHALDGIEGRCLIYCDPPYKDTTYKYGSSHGFVSEELYTTLEEWKSQGHRIVVSEGTYPTGRILLDEKRINNRKKQGFFQEKLYLL